jgi:putative heme iron utilization protein
MANVTIREYHPETGALLGNIATLQIGRVTSGTHSRVKVIDLVFTEVSAVGNIKIGLVSNGNLIVNTNPQDLLPDGTSSSGYFGIASSADFDANVASAPLTRHFAGINSTVTAANSNNVLIGNRNATTSNYIYLDVEVGSSILNALSGAYKLFYDFS